MFPALAGQTLKIPLSFQYRSWCIAAIIMAMFNRGKASFFFERESFKALNQSALMDDLDSNMHIWISLTGAPVPVLSTADQVTVYTFTWLTQRPVIDNMPVFCLRTLAATLTKLTLCVCKLCLHTHNFYFFNSYDKKNHAKGLVVLKKNPAQRNVFP